MVSIYCIEDINDLKYVGSTKVTLNQRLYNHRSNKNRNNYCSSSKLNLYNCIIYQLEKCEEKDRLERERYWINKIDCVNKNKLNSFDKEKIKEYQGLYREKNREILNEKHRIYREKNRKILNEKQRIYREKNREMVNARKRELYKLKKENQIKEWLND